MNTGKWCVIFIAGKLKGQPPSKSLLFLHPHRKRRRIVDEDEDWVPQASTSGFCS